MEFSITGVNRAQGSKSAQAATKRPPQYTVRAGDTLSSIAKQYGMTVAEFQKWTGVKSASLKVGQKMTLKQDKIKPGEGLSAFIRRQGMDKEAFCAMNGIKLKDFNNYKAQAGEAFYVQKGFKKGQAAPSQNSASPSKAPEKSRSSSNVSSTSLVSSKKISSKYKGKKADTEGKTVVTSPRTSSNPDDIRIGMTSKLPPVPVDANGNITADVVTFKPKHPNTGELKGKTIMVNAGHGWVGDGSFDPGVPATDINGKEIDEWRKNRDYAAELIKELTAKGATVIFTAGKADLVCKEKKNRKVDAFISVHCNSSANRGISGLQAYHMKDNATGNNFATTVAKKLNASVKNDTEGGHTSIGVLRAKNYTPSILLEMGFMTNNHDQLNIDSIATRQKQMKVVADGIVETLKPKTKGK